MLKNGHAALKAQLAIVGGRTQPLRPKIANRTDERSDRTYTIRELTKEFGLTARALRFYEAEDLVAPARYGQARIYSRRDRARLTLIMRGRRVGLSLAVIREILDLYDCDDGEVRQNLHARAKLIERIDVLERQKIDIAMALSELRRAVRRMDARSP